MTTEEKAVPLSARRLPARLNTEQLALLLGIHADDVGLLVSSRLLRPLGHPNKNAPKFFMTAQWEELRQDSRWLAKMSNAIVNHHLKRTGQQKKWNPHPGVSSGNPFLL
jgi:hypothetical protein